MCSVRSSHRRVQIFVARLTAHIRSAVLGILSDLGCSSDTLKYDSSFLFMGFIGASILLNIILTGLIIHRLRAVRKSTHRAISAVNRRNERHSNPYSSVITIVVESAAAWTIAALAYLIVLILPLTPYPSGWAQAQEEAAAYFLEYIFQITVVWPLSWIPLHRFLTIHHQPLSPAVLIFRVAINKHFATPEEVRTWEASQHHGRDFVDLEHRQSGQGGERLPAYKATDDLSAFDGPSSWCVVIRPSSPTSS
jgi:hypothetical protein